MVWVIGFGAQAVGLGVEGSTSFSLERRGVVYLGLGEVTLDPGRHLWTGTPWTSPLDSAAAGQRAGNLAGTMRRGLRVEGVESRGLGDRV